MSTVAGALAGFIVGVSLMALAVAHTEADAAKRGWDEVGGKLMVEAPIPKPGAE